MKLEEGMFVRDKDGTIAKIERIINNEIHFDIKPIFSDGECLGYNWFNIYMKNVVKASHNIKDLIEAGDYVNGSKVSMVESEFIYWETGNAIHYKYIETIVTKEQFENMSYRLEDEE